MQSRAPHSRGSDTHTSASKQISQPASEETSSVQRQGRCFSRILGKSSSDGLIQQRGDILLLVAMGCTKDHYTVLQGRETHGADCLIWTAAARSSQRSVTRCRILSSCDTILQQTQFEGEKVYFGSQLWIPGKPKQLTTARVHFCVPHASLT